MSDDALDVRIASGLILAYMNLFGFRGWASFWGAIYVRDGWEHERRLIAHEVKHLEQIQRDGIVAFSVKYLWWLIRYGYRDNPYEIEARAAETP